VITGFPQVSLRAADIVVEQSGHEIVVSRAPHLSKGVVNDMGWTFALGIGDGHRYAAVTGRIKELKMAQERRFGVSLANDKDCLLGSPARATPSLAPGHCT
jgi:hypothetical protein